MDQARIIGYLQGAEAHVANPNKISLPSAILNSTVERTRHAAPSAIARLREMESTQMQRMADREWLRAELAGPNAVEAAKADPSIVTATEDPRLRS